MSEEIYNNDIYENVGTPSNQQRHSGVNLFRLLFMSFGLLCILQATLNISLRLTVYKTLDTEAMLKNVTEERDELKRKLTVLDRTGNMTLDTTTILNTVTEERDELKGKLTVFAEYCRQGWEYLNDSFYYLSSRQESWQDSRSYCLQRDADLLIINSIEEQEFARHWQKPIWIGLTDQGTEGVWKWVDGTPLNTSYWGTGEPNSHEGKEEDCGEIRFLDKQNSWNDVQCENKKFWICERKLPLQISYQTLKTTSET